MPSSCRISTISCPFCCFLQGLCRTRGHEDDMLTLDPASQKEGDSQKRQGRLPTSHPAASCTNWSCACDESCQLLSLDRISKGKDEALIPPPKTPEGPQGLQSCNLRCGISIAHSWRAILELLAQFSFPVTIIGKPDSLRFVTN
jgi:hypothetical protein